MKAGERIRAVRRILVGVGLYGAGTYVPAVVSLIGVVVFTRKVDAATFGRFSIWFAIVAAVSSCAAQWLRQGVVRYWAVRRDDATFAASVWFLLALTVASVVVLAVATTAVLWIAGSDWMSLCIAGAVATSAMTVQIVHWAVWQAEHRPGRYALARSATAFVTFGVTLVMLSSGTDGLVALVAGVLAGLVLVAVASLVDPSLRSPLKGPSRRPRLDRAVAAELGRYGVPLVGWFAATMVLTFGDRILLGLIIDAAAAGVYSSVYAQLSGLATFVGMPLVLHAHPNLVDSWAAGDSQRSAQTMSRYVRAYAVAAVPVTAAIMAAAPAVAWVLVPESYGSDPLLVLILTPAMFLNVAGMLLHKPFEVAEKTTTMMRAMVVAALVNVLLNIGLIPVWGIHGAAVATLVAYALYAVGVVFLSRRILPLSAKVIRPGQVLAVGVACAAVTLLGVSALQTAGTWSGLAVAAVAATAGVLALAGFDLHRNGMERSTLHRQEIPT